ncbi:vomeronasal type-1 receptor 1-like [Trichosurus vulpecula]|uniref:vomeronasal type-1 receptor 1-like n=1 Tax=Trichosurus vulpecula TaxID=9337 RepID=UPI00186B01C4|nr:vomeronasal type-1 receptor 1-like [Trichosurus vulpecula]
MQSSDDILCIFYMLQIIIGVFGNVLLLCLYAFNLISSQRIRPIDVIFVNLALSHIVMILFRGIPVAIQVCIQKIFLSDIECKIIVYLQRVSRGLSLCTTCLLSVFQAITIIPSSPKWVKVKAKVPQCLIPSCAFMWVFNLLTDLVVPMHVTGPRNDTVSNLNRNPGFCFMDWKGMSASKLVIWKSLHDAVFLGLMAISSGYVMHVLFRHHWQVQHLHNTSLNPIASPETRATKVILLLTIFFVCCYSGASIIIIIVENSKEIERWVTYMSIFLTSSYSTICPFVLISSDSQILSFCNVFKRRKNSYPNLLVS